MLWLACIGYCRGVVVDTSGPVGLANTLGHRLGVTVHGTNSNTVFIVGSWFCVLQSDVVFLIDASLSMAGKHWKNQLVFVRNYIQHLDVGENKTRYADPGGGCSFAASC